mgnify:FL=1
MAANLYQTNSVNFHSVTLYTYPLTSWSKSVVSSEWDTFTIKLTVDENWSPTNELIIESANK